MRSWSVRLPVLHGAAGPVTHRAVARMAIGTNLADKDWRPGNWMKIQYLVQAAAPILVEIQTQSFDIALADPGPVSFEVNFGRDLNLAQMVTGRCVLDDRFAKYLGSRG